MPLSGGSGATWQQAPTFPKGGGATATGIDCWFRPVYLGDPGATLTVTFTQPAQKAVLVAETFSGTLLADPLHKSSAKWNNAAATALTTNAITTTIDGCLLVTFYTQRDASIATTYLTSDGSTERDDRSCAGSSEVAAATYDLAQATQGAYTGSNTASQSLDYCAGVLALTPSGTPTFQTLGANALASGASSGTVVVSASATVGDLLVLWVGYGGGSPVTTPAAYNPAWFYPNPSRLPGRIMPGGLWVPRSYGGGQVVSGPSATGATVGEQRTTGTTAGTRGAAGGAQGGLRVTGQSTGVKGGVGTASGQQRTSGVVADVKQAVGGAQGQQRSSGTTAIRKQATAAAVGEQRSAGVAVKGTPPTGPAIGQVRAVGTNTGTKAATGTATAGQTRIAGLAAGIRRAIGAAIGQQRTADAAVGSKAGRGAAVGPVRTAGASVATPPAISGHGTATALTIGGTAIATTIGGTATADQTGGHATTSGTPGTIQVLDTQGEVTLE